MKKTIRVNASAQSYEAIIGSDILNEQVRKTSDSFDGSVNYVLIDENVEKNHSQWINRVFEETGKDLCLMSIPQGEISKSISFWQTCMDFLLENGVRRNTPVYVIGGGVTGDVGGFAAASVLRGVPLIHIPTTLLAMVDSSIGGKTGINHAAGKNLIGAFYQPQRVIADISFLSTLPRKEWMNGLSEILKYGAIEQSDIFERSSIFFETDTRQIDPEKLTDLIADCIRIKAGIVEKDEFEGGVRAFLNFGHTFAHALEKECSYEKMNHGEAVFLGMLAAVTLSQHFGAGISVDRLQKFRPLYHYRVSKEELSLDNLMAHMQFDKKRTNKHIRFVLLDEWQQPVLKEVDTDNPIHQAWQTIFNEL